MEKLAFLIHEPKNKGQQIEGSLRFIFNNDAYYQSISNNPARLNAAAIICFKERFDGYHAFVIREALKELDSTGMIDYGASPYIMNEE